MHAAHAVRRDHHIYCASQGIVFAALLSLSVVVPSHHFASRTQTAPRCAEPLGHDVTVVQGSVCLPGPRPLGRPTLKSAVVAAAQAHSAARTFRGLAEHWQRVDSALVVSTVHPCATGLRCASSLVAPVRSKHGDARARCALCPCEAMPRKPLQSYASCISRLCVTFRLPALAQSRTALSATSLCQRSCDCFRGRPHHQRPCKWHARYVQSPCSCCGASKLGMWARAMCLSNACLTRSHLRGCTAAVTSGMSSCP